MKMLHHLLMTAGLVLGQYAVAQTFTMSNACTKMLKQAESHNTARQYDSALIVLNQFKGKCTAKDAKFKGGTAFAHAYNGLGRYSEALDAANSALKINKTWIAALFERAVAYAGLGQTKESKADYERIIALSAKNKNVSERASIYAMLGDIQYQQGQTDSAMIQVQNAIALDPKPDYYIQMGDFYYKSKEYNQAFNWYDSARIKGKDDVEMSSIVAAQRMRMYQKKYGTENVNELAKKMTAAEKQTLCADIKKLKSFGRKDMKTDMANAILCL